MEHPDVYVDGLRIHEEADMEFNIPEPTENEHKTYHFLLWVVF